MCILTIQSIHEICVFVVFSFGIMWSGLWLVENDVEIGGEVDP